MNVNEWLMLMLEEIRRKTREREEALEERARRQPGGHAPAGAGEAREAAPASRSPTVPGRD